LDLSVWGEDAFGEALDHGAGEGEILRARMRSHPGMTRRTRTKRKYFDIDPIALLFFSWGAFIAGG